MNRTLTSILVALAVTVQGYAAKQVINIGVSANDHTGDTLRQAFIKTNANFTELYPLSLGGTVISVGMTVPNWLSVTGSPITTGGTLAVGVASQAQGLFLASPSSAEGVMAPRAIAASDIPALPYVLTSAISSLPFLSTTGPDTLTIAEVGDSTAINGLRLNNPTDAALGFPQNSPSLSLKGSGQDATGITYNEFSLLTRPLANGSGSQPAFLEFRYAANGGLPGLVASLSHTGSLIVADINGVILSGSGTLNIGTGGTLGSAAFTAATSYEVPLTISTGLTRTGNTITVNGVQNITRLSNLTTNGIVKTSGSNGTVGIAVAADFPTLDQSTTGSAATLTTSRTINGTSFNGSANITIGTTVGANLVGLTNPSAISFIKIAADNTVSTRTPAQVLSDIGAQASGTYAVLGANTFTGDQTLSSSACLKLATTSATAGQIQINGTVVFHAYGTDNVFFGQTPANFSLTGTGRNVGAGKNVLHSATAATGITALGFQAGYYLTDGDSDVFIGYNAGLTLTTGDSCTLIGYSADVNSANSQYRTVIGAEAIGTANNTITLGRSSDTTVISGPATLGGPIRRKGYTVSTLPAGTQGDSAYVTDALAPVFLGTLTGGGAVVTPVFHNGTAWVAG